MDTATASSVTATGSGRSSSTRPCGRRHKAGEKLFVDYAGQTVSVVDPETGEIREAQMFVATLGASNYTYAEAHWSQSLPNWIAAHVRAFAFLGGVPSRAGAGQSQGRCDQSQPVRAGPQSHLPGICPSLWRGRGASPGAQTAGQGQGRSGCPGGGALDPGPLARPHLFRSGRCSTRPLPNCWPNSTSGR